MGIGRLDLLLGAGRCSADELLGAAGQPWPGVRYACTLRVGGVSPAPYDAWNLGAHVGDAAVSVARNRALLRTCLPDEPLWLEQVHGAQVHQADAGVPPVQPPRADAAVTQRAGQVLCILTADCLPVVLSDVEGLVLGVAHAGWRGLAAGVLEATLACMQARLPQAKGWRAWLGPAISQAHFEVGADVLAEFADADAEARTCFVPGLRPQRWMADLPALAALRLRRAGVVDIENSGLCTFAEQARFYSYRRDGLTGRMATVAWLEPHGARHEAR